MDSIGNAENSEKTNNRKIPKVEAEEVQHALIVLAKYGIIPNLKLIEERTGVKMKSEIIARVRGEDGQIKKIYEYENGKLKK